MKLSLVLLWCNNIVDFEDHLDHLCCQFKLLSLRHDRFVNTLLVHICGSLVICIDSDEWVIFRDLFLAQFTYIFNWVVTRVLCQSQWDFFKGICECSHSVLFDSLDFISLCSDRNGASKFSCTTSTNDVVVLDHVTDNTDCIMKASLCFITNRA